MKCSKCYKEIPNDSKICPIYQNIFASFFQETKLTKKQKIELFLHKAIFPFIIALTILTLISLICISQTIKSNRITDISELQIDINSKDYINELYISDGRHYKYLLNKQEKKIYDQIYNAIKKNEDTVIIDVNENKIDVSKFATKTFKKIKNILSLDHPELINVSTIIITSKKENQIIININYILNKNDYVPQVINIQQMINELKEQTKEMDDYNKVKFVYEWFYNNTEYKVKKGNATYSTKECFINRKCDNHTYAKTIQIVLQNLNINSILAIGTFNNKYHEWNIVKINNKYYYYDQTISKQSKDKINYDGLLYKNKNYKLYYKSLMPTISTYK